MTYNASVSQGRFNNIIDDVTASVLRHARTHHKRVAKKWHNTLAQEIRDHLSPRTLAYIIKDYETPDAVGRNGALMGRDSISEADITFMLHRAFIKSIFSESKRRQFSVLSYFFFHQNFYAFLFRTILPVRPPSLTPFLTDSPRQWF